MKKLIILFCFFITSSFSFSAIQEAYLAGGCFWCVESDLEKVEGVKEVTSGFSGGNIANPRYEDVSRGGTGHRESVFVKYDDNEINYSSLLYYFLKKIDPTDKKGQFVDRGYQYSPAIFYRTERERQLALVVLEKVKKEGNFKEIGVELIKFKNFYPAEEYHQDYYKKNPLRYKFYRYRSGRDQFLEDTWK
nr:peptide-methionine (S)-S-oxide reductase MsrA [uncultured Cetobacterium sp.]